MLITYYKQIARYDLLKQVMLIVLFFIVFSVQAKNMQGTANSSKRKTSKRETETKEQLQQESYSVYNFGTIKEGEKPIHQFSFTNTTQEKLKILKIRIPCGCADVKVIKNILEPGDTSKFDVKLKSNGRNGRISKNFYLLTDSKKIPMVKYTLKATVIPKPSPLCLVPANITLGVMKPNENKHFCFDFKNKGTIDLKIYKKIIPKNVKALTGFPITVKPGGLRSFDLNITAPAEVGKFHKELIFKSNDRKKVVILVILRGEVKK